MGPGLLQLVRKEIRSLKFPQSCAKNFTVEVALQEVNQGFQYFTGSNGLSEVIIICSGIYLLPQVQEIWLSFFWVFPNHLKQVSVVVSASQL